MRTIQKTLNIIFSAILFFGCNGQQTKHNTNKFANSDSSHVSTNSPLIDVYEYETIKDTLRIISTSNFLYYPFGIYRNSKEFVNNFDFVKTVVEPITFVGDPDTINLYSFYFKNSEIKFLLDSETNNMELVFAKIMDQEILIKSQIKIGMSKNHFITSLNDNIKTGGLENVKVVELVSGLLGIWQYYTFNDDRLSSLTIITDYQIQYK